VKACSAVLWLSLFQPDPASLAALYRENVARIESQYGHDHPKTRTARRDLGLFLARYGDKREAESVLRTCAETAADFAQLAELVPVSQASAFYRLAVLKEEQTSGPTSPKTAVRLNDLALTVQPHEAEPLLRRALGINEAALGTAHLETAVTLNNLADVLAALRRFKEAEPYALRSFKILETTLGPKSDRTQTAADNLRAIQRALGRKGSAP
jgi:tetratricopeptide (TPR) repeat protein